MDVKHKDTAKLVEKGRYFLAVHLCNYGDGFTPDEYTPYMCSAKDLDEGTYPHVTDILAVFGRYGTGKTHFAAAIVNGFVGLGVAARYAYVPDLLDELRASYRNKDEDEGYYELLDKLKRVTVLALDDLGVEKASDWADEQLDKIVDYRYREEKPTIITTNMNIKDLSPRIADRLREPLASECVILTSSSYRTNVKPL